MADLYRKSSLEKLSNPEQLDRQIEISSPMSWLALIAVLLIVAAAVLWSILGTLPTMETAEGIIVSRDEACAVYSDVSGTLIKLYKASGDTLAAGDALADVRMSGGETKTIVSDRDGTVGAVSAAVGEPVYFGTELVRITPDSVGEQLLVCYIPFDLSPKYRPGMKVLVYPSSADSQRDGHMEAELVYIDRFAANVDSMAYVIGSGNLLADRFLSNGPVVSAVCRLRGDAASENGYYWSGNGGALSVQNGELVSAKVVLEECAPITKLFGSLKRGAEAGK